jgi:hypothetical protein
MVYKYVVVANSTKTQNGWERDIKKYVFDGIPHDINMQNAAVMKFAMEMCAWKDTELKCYFNGCTNKVKIPGRIMTKTSACECTEFAYFMSFPCCEIHQSQAQDIKEYMMKKMVDTKDSIPTRTPLNPNKKIPKIREKVLKGLGIWYNEHNYLPECTQLKREMDRVGPFTPLGSHRC